MCVITKKTQISSSKSRIVTCSAVYHNWFISRDRGHLVCISQSTLRFIPYGSRYMSILILVFPVQVYYVVLLRIAEYFISGYKDICRSFLKQFSESCCSCLLYTSD